MVCLWRLIALSQSSLITGNILTYVTVVPQLSRIFSVLQNGHAMGLWFTLQYYVKQTLSVYLFVFCDKFEKRQFFNISFLTLKNCNFTTLRYCPFVFYGILTNSLSYLIWYFEQTVTTKVYLVFIPKTFVILWNLKFNIHFSPYYHITIFSILI